MAFDPTNDTLYVTSGYGTPVIFQLWHAFHVSTTPAGRNHLVRWKFTVLAGRSFPGSYLSVNVGNPGVEEMSPLLANFSLPTGVVGWPSYAVGRFLLPPPRRHALQGQTHQAGWECGCVIAPTMRFGISTSGEATT